ncbi:uncharacterized protein LOC135835159 [Planococcus citri]|uniref:uncharacterized protein LOC135835159 n=1 Tax=Planococcus citri TaxID=170843 RepID=UPI0031F7D66A
MAPTVRIPNLKEIASARIAVALWNHLDIPEILWIDNKNDYETPLIDDVLELVKQLPLFDSVETLVKTHVQKVKTELESWVFHISRYILHPKGTKNELYCDIDKIIWYSDCTINYKTTARNLLNSLRLSELEKYHILCWYCFIDEIHRLSPLLFTERVVDHTDFDSDALIYYWNCYFRNKLDKIPVEEGLSLDVFMFRDEYLTWPAREYFFDQLNEEEQVENFIWLLDNNGNMYMYQKQLLMKLNENQLLRVYKDRAVRIIDHFVYTDDHFQEILPTWYDVRDLITADQFASILKKLLGTLMQGGVPGSILIEIWTSARNDFRSHVLNNLPIVIFEKTLDWWKRTKDESFLTTLLQVANANLKREIRSGPFFNQFCKDMVLRLQLKELECLFRVWSLSGDDLNQFKRDFTNTEFFVDTCETIFKLGTSPFDSDDEKNYIAELEHLWNIWFTDVEEVTRFKRDFTRNSLFLDRCESLCHGDFSTLESVLNLCLLDDEEFERNLAKSKYLFEYCEELVISGRLKTLQQLLKICFRNVDALTELQNKFVKKTFFETKCRKLIKHEKIDVLKSLFKCCLSNTEEATRFKQGLVSEWVPMYYFDQYPFTPQILTQLLNLCLPKSPESVQFMRDLVYDSYYVKKNYLQWSRYEKPKTMSDWLMALFMSQSNLVAEFKKHAWMSSEGVMRAADFFPYEKSDKLNEIIADVFPDTESANEFRRKIMFSSEMTYKLKRLILIDDTKSLNEAKELIEGFLTSNEDQRTLKKHLIDNLRLKNTELFYKYGDSGWQSLVQWCLEDEEAVRAFKWELPIDEFFENKLKECTFQTYDEHHRVSRCTLKKGFVFDSLDQILNWYFESPTKVKEYKVRKINDYENIKTINTLLKKNCHSSYMVKLMDWFFENDHVEMAKFKKKHEGEQFVNLIRIRRQSYFKK